jgi:hypothetical protein
MISVVKLLTMIATLPQLGQYRAIFEAKVRMVLCTTIQYPISARRLRPVIFSNCRQERHLSYKWDGRRVVQVYDYTAGAMREL